MDKTIGERLRDLQHDREYLNRIMPESFPSQVEFIAKWTEIHNQQAEDRFNRAEQHIIRGYN